MKTFYEMTLLMEQAQLSLVEKFPQDFEQVLNFISGGSWSFMSNKNSPMITATTHGGGFFFYMQTMYRGISESGRHYTITVWLMNPVGSAKGNKIFQIMNSWSHESSYDPKGGAGIAVGSSEFDFFLYEIRELGPDKDDRPKKLPDNRTAWEKAEDEKKLTPQQKQIDSLLAQLDTLSKDIPVKKWTPENRFYLGSENSIKHKRPVDLAKQIKDEIAKYESQHPSFNSH